MNKKNISISTLALAFFAIIGLIFGMTIIASNIKSKKSFQELRSHNVFKSTKNKIWADSALREVKAGDEFQLDVYVDSEADSMGFFSVDLEFDSQKFLVNADKGDDGLEKGRDSGNFIILANPEKISQGKYMLSGICAEGCVKGQKKHLAIIHAKALKDFELKNNTYNLIIKEMGNQFGKSFSE